ncbi:MAG: PilZ domain-containing protein [SAR324 cluster bacterium]|nr:PilZ domain-containing protein [SAR324 cluster bacterium]
MEPERYIEVGEERRWELQTPIQIYIREDLPHLAGHSRDISLYGIHIEIGVKLPINSLVTLEVYFQRANVFDFIDQDPLKVKAQVVWRNALSEDDYSSWETGLQFVNITQEQQNTVRNEVTVLEELIPEA